MNDIACHNCNRPNPPGSRFCNHCGQPLPASSKRLCQNCNHANPTHLLYCDNCGNRLSGTSTVQDIITGTGELEGPKAFSLPSRKSGEIGDLDLDKISTDNLPDWLTARKEHEAAETSAGGEDKVIPDWIDQLEDEELESDDKKRSTAAFDAFANWLSDLDEDDEGERDIRDTAGFSLPSRVTDMLSASDVETDSAPDAILEDDESEPVPLPSQPVSTQEPPAELPDDSADDIDDAEDFDEVLPGWLADARAKLQSNASKSQADRDQENFATQIELPAWLQSRSSEDDDDQEWLEDEKTSAAFDHWRTNLLEDEESPAEPSYGEDVSDPLLAEDNEDTGDEAGSEVPDWLSNLMETGSLQAPDFLEEDEAEPEEPEEPEDDDELELPDFATESDDPVATGLTAWLNRLTPEEVSQEQEDQQDTVEADESTAPLDATDWLDKLQSTSELTDRSIESQSDEEGEDQAQLDIPPPPEMPSWLTDLSPRGTGLLSRGSGMGDPSADADDESDTGNIMRHLSPLDSVPDWLAALPEEEEIEAASVPIEGHVEETVGQVDLEEVDLEEDELDDFSFDEPEIPEDEMSEWLATMAATGQLDPSKLPEEWVDADDQADESEAEYLEDDDSSDAWLSELMEEEGSEALLTEDSSPNLKIDEPESEITQEDDWEELAAPSYDSEQRSESEESPVSEASFEFDWGDVEFDNEEYDAATVPPASGAEADIEEEFEGEEPLFSIESSVEGDDDSVPDWLQDMMGVEGDTEELVEDAEGFVPPEFLETDAARAEDASARETGTGELPGVPEDLAGADLPDWLSESTESRPSTARKTSRNDLEAADGPGDITYDDLPDWLMPEESEDFDEALTEAMSVRSEAETIEGDWDGDFDEQGDSGLTLPSAQQFSEMVDEDSGLVQTSLPEWVLALKPNELRAVGEEPLQIAVQMSGPLAGMRGVIDIEPAMAEPQQGSLNIPTFEVTPSQRKQVAMLRQLNFAATPPTSSSVTPHLPPLARTWRLLLALFLFLVVLVGITRPGVINIPTGGLEPGPELAAIQTRIQQAAGQDVLVVFDYTPSYAGELDVVGRAMLDHLNVAGAEITTISQSAAGVVMADTLAADLEIQASHLGYLPGGATGLRMLSSCIDNQQSCLVPNGATFGQSDVQDFSLIVVLSGDRSQFVNWIEQVQQSTSIDMIAGVTQSVYPLIRPYQTSEQLVGILNGVPAAQAYASATTGIAPGGPDSAVLTLTQWMIVLFLLVGNVFYLAKGLVADNSKSKSKPSDKVSRSQTTER